MAKTVVKPGRNGTAQEGRGHVNEVMQLKRIINLLQCLTPLSTSVFQSPWSHAIALSLVFMTETEMSCIGLVDRVSRTPSPIQGIPERQPYVDPRMLHADAPGHCAWLLGVGPAQPLVPVYHYPKRWCPVEAGRGPDKTRPVTTAPEEVEVPSRPGVGAASAGVGNRPPTGNCADRPSPNPT